VEEKAISTIKEADTDISVGWNAAFANARARPFLWVAAFPMIGQKVFRQNER
jgi:hypothetical protein